MGKKIRFPYPDTALAELQGTRRIGRPEDRQPRETRPGFWIKRSVVKDTLDFVQERRAIYQARIDDPNCYPSDWADAMWSIFLIDTVNQRGEAELKAIEKEFLERSPAESYLLSRDEMHKRFNYVYRFFTQGRACGIRSGRDPRIEPYERPLDFMFS